MIYGLIVSIGGDQYEAYIRDIYLMQKKWKWI